MEKMLTVGEVAEFLRLRPETIRRKIREKRLPHTKTGKKFLISESELKNFLKNCSPA